MSTRSERGTLLVADLSGYTEYLVSAEIEHASAIAADLLDRVVTSIEPSFVVNRVIGDAVLAWAPDGVVDGRGFLAAVDRVYADFRHRALRVYEATSCSCQACGRVWRLDLKMIAHHGEFVRHTVAGREELSGRDVILVNLLLKNSLQRSGPQSGYLLATDACVRALEIDPAAEEMTPHLERYEHIGDISAWVASLNDRWSRLGWDPDGPAALSISAVFPMPLDDAWAILAPERSPACVTTFLEELDEILEWRPPRRLVLRIQNGTRRFIHEVTLEPIAERTSVSLAWYAESGDREQGEATEVLRLRTQSILTAAGATEIRVDSALPEPS